VAPDPGELWFAVRSYSGEVTDETDPLVLMVTD
jgi:hypothetical protein